MATHNLAALSPCPLCARIPFNHVLTKFGYAIVRCQNCDLLYVNPIPSDEELQQHYQNPAYFEGESEQGYASYAAMKIALTPFFKRRLHVLAEHLPHRGHLLDFGCAAGYFLELARADGWQIAGVELAADMAGQAAQTLSIPIRDTLAKLTHPQFEAITMWEVIEHLPNPVDQLHQFYERLRPGGLLMVSTPNTGHWQAQREPDGWVGYRPPSHLLFFTEKTLTTALTTAGFTQITIRRVSPLPPLPAWLRYISAPLQQNLANGQARFWQASLYTWRAIRLLGWGWQKITHPTDDIFATLEAVAIKPK